VTSGNVFNPGKWFARPQAKEGGDVRLLIFPYAGGGPASFNQWEFPENIEVLTAHYPGRGSRYNEAPISSLSNLVHEFGNAIQSVLDKPMIFFGHSLGGLVAFELTRILRSNNLEAPSLLVVSGCGAPQLPDSHPKIHNLPDNEFLSALEKLKGIPSEALQNDELMKFLLPSLHADFEAAETYIYKHEVPLDIPIIALGGEDDPRVSREMLEGWADQTKVRFEPHIFPGGHFFINDAADSIIQLLLKEISHAP